MSVKTTADEKLDDAATHLHQAQLALVDIVYRRCWGHDEYSNEYSSAIKEVLELTHVAIGKLNRSINLE